MNHFTQRELETIFANNFASPTFPVLANLYYKQKEYNRAQKVCEIGLSHNKNNFIGQYVLAKTYLIQKKYIKAEKILKTIVTNDCNNTNAIIKLVNLQGLLKRSDKTIQKYINQGIHLGITNKLFKKTKSPQNKKKVVSKAKNKNPSPFTKDPLTINVNMATKTMYNLMFKQKKYDIAVSILEIMNLKVKNKKFVTKEMKIIKNLLNKGN